MQLEARPFAALIRRCAFLLLALSVFVLGLQARLALYQSVPSINVTSAKISTERQTAQVLRSLEEREESHEPADKLSVALLLSGVYLQHAGLSRLEETQLSLTSPMRPALRRDNTLHLPPPARS